MLLQVSDRIVCNTYHACRARCSRVSVKPICSICALQAFCLTWLARRRKGLGFSASVETLWRADHASGRSLSLSWLCFFLSRSTIPATSCAGPHVSATSPSPCLALIQVRLCLAARGMPLGCSDLCPGPDRVGLLDAGSFVESWARPRWSPLELYEYHAVLADTTRYKCAR